VEELLNVKELAEYLKCTEQTVRRYVMRNKIPYHKIDRMVRFWPSEIREWVNKNNEGGNKALCETVNNTVDKKEGE